MVRSCSSSSSSSSSVSFTSLDDLSVGKSSTTVKFLCSYGGRILPRYSDGKLRFVGGETRVLAVDRNLAFSDLLAKMGELCGFNQLSLRCQMPMEDLDALVSIRSDEDLANLVEEYDLAGIDRKIRAFLYPFPPPSSTLSEENLSVPVKSIGHRHHHQISSPPGNRSGGGNRRYPCHHQYRHHQHQYSVHHGNHWSAHGQS